MAKTIQKERLCYPAKRKGTEIQSSHTRRDFGERGVVNIKSKVEPTNHAIIITCKRKKEEVTKI